MADALIRQEKRIPVLIRGNQTYAPGTTFRVAFDDIQPLRNGVSYVRGVELAFDMVLNAGGNVNFPEALIFRIIEGINCRIPGGHVFYDLASHAGVSFRALLWAMMGMRPTAPNGGAGGAISVPTAATNVRLKFYLPFFLWGGVEGDDANIPLQDLAKTSVEFLWAQAASSGTPAGGIFSTGANNERVDSGTVRAHVDLVSREEYRRPAMFSYVMALLPGIEEQLQVADRALHWLIEVPTQVNGLTETFLTDANRDLVTLEVDGSPYVDRMDTRDTASSWNRIHAADRAEELPNVEGNASPWMPLYVPQRRPYKITTVPASKKNMKLRLTGTTTTPRVVYATTGLNNRDAVVSGIGNAGANGLNVPDGFAAEPERFLTAKSAAKSLVRPGLGGFQRLPIRLHGQRVE